MPKTRLIRKYLSVLVLVSALCRIPQLLAQGEEEKRPLIDVEDYNVEVELLPAANQVKARQPLNIPRRRPSYLYELQGTRSRSSHWPVNFTLRCRQIRKEQNYDEIEYYPHRCAWLFRSRQ